MAADSPITNLPREDSGDLLLRKVQQALAMSREERFRAGGDLFELACEAARAGIRASLGSDDPEEVERRLRERLRLQDKLDQQDSRQ